MKKWSCFVLALVVIVVDQLSKYWAASVLIPYQPVSIFPLFNLTLAYNSGAAFSFLSGTGEWHRWVFAGFSFFMSLVLMVAIIRAPSTLKLQLVALSLILGGAIGNLIDRALLGHVIDFIDIYYKSSHWPIFNLADSAICLGAFLLLWGSCS